ncbi:BTB/POZ and MATH domain-containing protein 1-like [Lolium rigidum]|uniref:BTB/POZ and MATH domain-containing protein 1-like n=1 Tax=Lolium rigidum TaxID=89674 RepID=UPI001F5D6EC2|nr:BTB/POZ and MATH domain-containing protein 1-like [Lolium rigidum]
METSKTSSTVVVVDIGEHLFKVEKHSLLTGANASIKSETFRVGGHDWAIAYYPNGDASIVDGQFMSIFIYLMSATESEVTASFSLCLQDRASPVTGEKNKTIFTKTFLPAMNHTGWGVSQFMSKDDLAASGCLEDDCLWIKCTVDISQLIAEDDDDRSSSITVPPSNLSTDVRSIIESGLKPDLTVKIGNSSRSFNANVCVLRARSPVFEVLLHYIYNDCLPGFMEEATEEATSMARDLLVAANGYGIQRLKVMCERRLSQSLDIHTVSSTLDLAEQYQCQQLKESCLKYMAKDGQRLRAIKKTEGFKQLIKNHPLIMGDIIDKVSDKLNRQAATTPAPTPPP